MFADGLISRTVIVYDLYESQRSEPASRRTVTQNDRQIQTTAGRVTDPQGLKEAIRHAKGEFTLKTTTLERPDRPPELDAGELTKLRLKSGMSQSVFAQVLNVSVKTVQRWEQGHASRRRRHWN